MLLNSLFSLEPPGYRKVNGVFLYCLKDGVWADLNTKPMYHADNDLANPALQETRTHPLEYTKHIVPSNAGILFCIE